MKIEVKLDQRVLDHLETTNEEIAELMEKGKFDINSSSIKITDITTATIFEQVLRFIKDPYTGIKRFDDDNSEKMYIKINEKEYNVRINAVDGGIRSNHRTILGIIK